MFYTNLTTRLGHSFRDPQWLETALTHRSFYFENRATTFMHNERLEFLGDAVLDLLISDALMDQFPLSEEGDLSKWRASLVNETTLSEIAHEWKVQDYLRLGRSEDIQRQKLSAGLMSSTVEAILGALYKDSGLEACRALILREFASRLSRLDESGQYTEDFKTRLQEFCQKEFKQLPEYELKDSQGPAHNRQFYSEVYLKTRLLAAGHGSSRKASEQAAARIAYEKLMEEKST